MSIIKQAKKIIDSKRILFTTPAHAGGKNILPEFKDLVGEKVFSADLSEIEDMDNLQNPSGIIKNSMENAARIYGTKKTFYLPNGSTSGIIALMLATSQKEEKILIARNAHKSVINALTLSGACPIWINPEYEEEWNIFSSINPEKIKQKLEEDPEIKSVWITSPTYEGVVSDIKAISELCKEKNVFLIVDEAHGALYSFSDRLPTSALKLGADACVQSLHKTGGAFTQGAVLHLGETSRICPEKLTNCLNLINTTSPSYLILASIEASILYLDSAEGRQSLENLLLDIEKTKDFLSKNLDISFLKSSDKYIHDPTKLVFKLNGYNGSDIADVLLEKFNIEVEMDNETWLLALTGIGTTREKLDKFAEALIQVETFLEKTNNNYSKYVLSEPEIVFTPAEVFGKKTEKISVFDAGGRICAETIVNYPPGIPLIAVGEKVKPEHLPVLEGRKVLEVVFE
jgi:arginine/lysine/ornithine decarboxylase